ncbi:MAG: hypothetical protein JSS10_01275 [Verrucomicrobia bacterium]|nr:hypothetical protein [Verrucomicrobiota bacterium]
MTLKLNNCFSRFGFSYQNGSEEESGFEGQEVLRDQLVDYVNESLNTQVHFKNSKVTLSNTEGQKSLRRVKHILAGSEDPDEIAYRYKKALKSEKVLPSHKLLLLSKKPKRPEWPFPDKN